MNPGVVSFEEGLSLASAGKPAQDLLALSQISLTHQNNRVNVYDCHVKLKPKIDTKICNY